MNSVASGTATTTLESMLEAARSAGAECVAMSKQILPVASLYNPNPDMGTMVVGLAGGNSTREQLTIVRAAAFFWGATLATITYEAWFAKFERQEDGRYDPDYIRVEAGEMRVRDLPPEKRDDCFLVYAEGPMRRRVTEIYRVVGSHPGRRIEPMVFDGFGTHRWEVSPNAPPPAAKAPPIFRTHFYPCLPANILAERLNPRGTPPTTPWPPGPEMRRKFDQWLRERHADLR